MVVPTRVRIALRHVWKHVVDVLLVTVLAMADVQEDVAGFVVETAQLAVADVIVRVTDVVVAVPLVKVAVVGNV